ncbi:hypothetical protein GGR56DRAFT_124589 [Xylariaceae sp. FL0804]|nr:hypothetical protein GGR56DRAFT_124589 [Xylariaceae sp. FL0804]
MIQTPSSAVDLPKDPKYVPECFAWYTIGVLVIILRYVTRIRTVGFAGFRGDDYLAILYLALYTACIAIVYITYHTGANVDVRPDLVDKLTDEDIEILEYGSKLEWISFFIYSGCIWTLKFSVLFFYNRITLGVLRPNSIRFLFWLCGLTYIMLCIVALCSCRPIWLNWQVRPQPPAHCLWGPQNFWALVFFNVVTDAALMSIPAPMLWHLRVPLRKKVGVSLLLSSGIFVISTAVARACLTLVGDPTAITINLWGFRELGIGLVAVTAPVVSPMATPEFWRRGPYLRNDRRRMLQFSLKGAGGGGGGGWRAQRKSGFRDAEDLELQEIDEATVAATYIGPYDDETEDVGGRKNRADSGFNDQIGSTR